MSIPQRIVYRASLVHAPETHRSRGEDVERDTSMWTGH